MHCSKAAPIFGLILVKGMEMTQRDKMRELYRHYSGNKEAVVKAYSEAERSGDVDRLRNASGYGTEQYARALWADGEKKGWLAQGGKASNVPSNISEPSQIPQPPSPLVRRSTTVDTPQKADDSSLIVAASNGNILAIRTILEQGANPNVMDTDGDSALMVAAYWGYSGIVELLIQSKADLTLKDNNGKTALDLAITNGHVEVTQLLERAKKDAYAKKAKSNISGLEHDPRLKMFLKELNEMTGLSRVKAEVNQHIKQIQSQKLRAERGYVNQQQTLHMVFTGNPGTGKTTIARLLGQIYKSMGILSEGQFIETDRAGLVGGYLGQTAIKTQQVIESALGGILFIDEAYSLADSTHGDDQYGREAVSTLLKMMEDHRDDFIVIVAGYTNEMGSFVESNSGLKVRFPDHKRIHFEDYTPDELVQISQYLAEQRDYSFDTAAIAKLENVFELLYQRRDEAFGNARLARNLLEKTISNHENWMSMAGKTDDESMVTLYSDDVPNY